MLVYALEVRYPELERTLVNEPLVEETIDLDEDDLENKYVLSLYDFGGQEVFQTCHHLFFTRSCLFCVTFSCEAMLKDRQE